MRDRLLGRDGAAGDAREEAQVGAHRVAVEPLVGLHVERAAAACVRAVDESHRAVHGVAPALDVHASFPLAFEQLLDAVVVRHASLP